jgi:hypothetical protein
MDSKENKELVSLNSQLPKFFVEELEERLETDPLMIGGLFDLAQTTTSQAEAGCWGYVQCDSDYRSCGWD